MLKEILSISGKPGLFKLINNTANALIVESLLDGKRFPAYSNAKIIALEDISIYTEDEDMPLKTVFKRMYEKEEGKPAINHKESSAAITNYIESVIPEYDADRVYVSDMRKMIQWYNLLLDKNLLNFDEPEEEKKEDSNNDGTVSGELGNSVKDLGEGVGNAVEDVGDAVGNATEGR